MKLCRCSADGVRNLGAHGYCAVHLEELYATFDRSAFAFAGIGLQDGPLRLDWGPHYADLRCNVCDATWVGVVGDGCTWCERSYQNQLEHHAEMVLRPPEVDIDDERRENAMKAWATRLWVAVEAGIIDQQQAERALRREVRRGSAA